MRNSDPFYLIPTTEALWEISLLFCYKPCSPRDLKSHVKDILNFLKFTSIGIRSQDNSALSIGLCSKRMSELHSSVIAAILRSIDSKVEDQQLQQVQAMITSGAEASGMKIRPERQLVYEWYTPSLARSVAFLQALGFKVLRQEQAFAEMGWGAESRLFVEEVAQDPAMPSGYHGFYHGNIRVLVPDVDAVYQAALVLPDGKILKTLEDRYYGLRDFTLGGPFGLALRFATPLPGFSED